MRTFDDKFNPVWRHPLSIENLRKFAEHLRKLAPETVETGAGAMVLALGGVRSSRDAAKLKR